MKKLSLFIGVVLASFYSTSLVAQNPIICDRYTPDPAPYVHGDTLYLFVDHDEDETLNNYFTMKDWLLYSTVDMVNWTYRGTPLTSATFSAWAKQDNDCWASQCIERNGKWYWYVTATIKGEAYPGIGVAVADNPAGPYKDPINKPLVKGWFKIDPTVFIDDNDQAYLYYGNNNLWYVKLNKNMTSFTGSEVSVNVKNETAFGPQRTTTATRTLRKHRGFTSATGNIIWSMLQAAYLSIGPTLRLVRLQVRGPIRARYWERQKTALPFMAEVWNIKVTTICSTTTASCLTVGAINVLPA